MGTPVRVVIAAQEDDQSVTQGLFEVRVSALERGPVRGSPERFLLMARSRLPRLRPCHGPFLMSTASSPTSGIACTTFSQDPRTGMPSLRTLPVTPYCPEGTPAPRAGAQR